MTTNGFLDSINVVQYNAKDIFFNNKYLNVLKDRDRICNIPYENKINKYILLKNESIPEKKMDIYDKSNNIFNNVKILSLAKIKKKFWKFRFLEKCICVKDSCAVCSYMCISIHYLIKKYFKLKLKNKNILTIHIANFNTSYLYINSHGTIFDTNTFFLFNNSKNCTIYAIIDNVQPHHKKTVVHKKNNTTYHILTYGTDNNILNKNTFDLILNRMKNINFDLIIFFQAYARYINTIYMACMYIITRNSRLTTKLIIDSRLYRIDRPNILLSVSKNIYTKTSFILTKFDGLINRSTYILCENINSNSLEYINIDIINKALNDNLNINFSEEVKYPEIIINYFIKLNKKIYKKYKLIYNILYRQNNKKLFNIIMQYIKTKQHYYADKYKKYLKSY